jgi:tetratricopeptide (TPR) repeat protein
MELAINHFREAAAAYRAIGDQVSVLRASTMLGRSLIFFHNEDEAVEVLRHAVQEAEPLGEVPELGATYAELARSYMLRNMFEDAIEAADRALSLGARLPTPATVVEALVTKGTSLLGVGRVVEAQAVLRGAIVMADRIGLVAAALRARNNIYGPVSLTDLEEAERLCREGYEMANRYGHRPFVFQFLFNVIEVGLKRGEWDSWMAELDALEESEVYPFYRSGYAAQRAMHLALRGDLDGAERALERAAAAAQELQSPQIDAYLQLIRAWLRFIAGAWAEAIEAAEAAAPDANFTVEAWWIAANAAAAGNRPAELEKAIEGLGQASHGLPLASAMERVAGAARAAMQGSPEEARLQLVEATPR